MASGILSKDSSIAIIGAGVFGLSTSEPSFQFNRHIALHLATSGYTDVTIFDYQPYDENAYSTTDGADAASADLNKVMRLSYGEEVLYQRLAFDGLTTWNAWNEELAATPARDLPKGFRPGDKVWDNCGFLRLSTDRNLSAHERSTLASLTADGLRDTQYIIGDPRDEERAKSKGWDKKFDPFKRKERGRNLVGVLDTTAGFVEASKTCLWALHLVRKAGVKCVLGKEVGRCISFLKEKERTVGIKTADGLDHSAELVVLAAGGWTPSLYPPVSPLLETTAGSVIYIQLPPEQERPDLWSRFSSENFPVYSWGGWSKGTGIGGFPRTDTGIMKIGFRGKKYTNYVTIEQDGQRYRLSAPKTKYTPETETRVTKEAIDSVKVFIRENIPELIEFGISGCRNCWYTDSLDNSFVIDRVPTDHGLMICSGGSGHGFKFLPILGREVVKIIEYPHNKNEYGHLWKWRTIDNGPKNGLEDGEAGPRVLSKQIMATAEDFKFSEAERARL
ncbi:FAD dependent oxidoreductase [Xylogone sp. PMI_703]|nr:FAD dependent oxidoreductase [Xylogone sp. PMI_703]